MIPHPAVWFARLPPQEHPMWKAWLRRLAGWIIRYGPGLVEAVVEAKAKDKAPKG